MRTKWILFLLAIVFLSPGTARAIFKNVASQKVTVYAYDTSGEASKTGDAANITAQISLDGAASVAITDTNPTELDATDHPGVYVFDFATTETNANLIVISGDSSTANIWIEPISIYTRTVMRGTDSAALATGVNVIQVSGDVTAADNLELQYDTTGLTGDTFPANQSQINQIANESGVAKRAAESYVLATGTQSANTVSSTEELDGVRHEHTDDAGEMDLYYEFQIGAGIATEVLVTGYLQGNNDDLEVYGYDWVSVGWKQVGIMEGQASAQNVVNSYNMLVDMVGSGANEGTVRVRFTDGAFTLTSALLAVDQILLEFSRSVEGYQNAAVWLDTNASNTNTVRGVDGTATNPVSTLAAANTLLASTNLRNVEVSPGSSLTFVGAQDGQVFNGRSWTLALGGQSISATTIIGADVSGICTGAAPPSFQDCNLGAITIPPSHVTECGLMGDITAGLAGAFFFDFCHSQVAGLATPSFDFGAALNSSDISFRAFSGGIEIKNMGAGTGSYNMSLEGWGQLIINANCSATATVAIRGNFTVTDNAGGAVTLSDNARYDTLQINAQADLALTDYDPPTKTEMDSAHALLATSTSLATVDSNVDAILVDTNELQTNQGNWLTATGFATSGALSTHDGKLDTVDGIVDAILVDTNDLQTNQGAWLTATGFATSGALTTHDGKLDTVDGIVDSILVNTARVDALVEDSSGDRFTVKALEAAPSGTGSTPAQMWAYSTRTLTSGGGGGDATLANQVLILADTNPILADTADLQTNQGNWLTATGFATSGALVTHDGNLDAWTTWAAPVLAEIGNDTDSLLSRLTALRAGYLDNLSAGAVAQASALATVDANVDTILATTNKLDDTVVDNAGTYEFTTASLANAPSGSGATAASVWAYVTRTNTAGTKDAEIDAIKVTTDKLDDTLEDNAGTYRFTAPALAEAPGGGGGGDATEAKQNEILADLADIQGTGFTSPTHSLFAIRTRGDSAWVTGGTGGGAYVTTYTLTYESPPETFTPIPNVTVEVYSESAKLNLVAAGSTDNFGKIVFYLDAGTYYMWNRKSGWNFTNPDTQVVP